MTRNIRSCVLKSERSLLVVMAFVFFSCSVFSQDVVIGLGYAEELYIQTDRDLYFTGEEVFVRLNKFNRLTESEGNFSKIGYIDLFSRSGTPVVQVKVGLGESYGAASFRIPDTLSTGNYLIRGYTSWMKNFPDVLYAFKQITVINPFDDIEDFKIRSREVPARVIFYPEAGTIVKGITTTIGFESKANNGDPVEIRGFLLDKGGDTLSVVTSDINGYGLFELPANAGDSCSLVTVNEDGFRNNRFFLPGIVDSGLSFKVEQREEGIAIYLSARGMLPDEITVEYLNDSFMPIVKRVGIENEQIVLFSNMEIPYGTAKVSILDNNGAEYASRWVYNEKKSDFPYGIEIERKQYSPREKVALKIKGTNDRNLRLASNIAISVVKSVLVDNNPFREMNRRDQSPLPGSIGTTRLLGSLNDYLIFLGNNELEIFSFDLASAEYAPELEGHRISGVLRNRETNDPLGNVNIILSFVGRSANCKFSKTDENGVFNFIVREKGFQEMVIAPLSDHIGDYYVEILDPFDLSFSKYPVAPFYLDSLRLEEINEAIIGMQIRNIYSPFLLEEEDTTESVGLNFYGEPDNVVYLSDYIELTTLKEVIKEIVPGVFTQKRSGEYNIRLLNNFPTGNFSTSPLILFDGVPMRNIDEILDVQAPEIERIDVFNTRYFIADIVMEGIIHFVSKKGDLSMIEFDRSIFRQGYYIVDEDNRTFHGPEYGSNEEPDNRLPDYRNTLFWEPCIEFDGNGEVEVDFYTSDEEGEYTVIIEGFDSDGGLIRGTSSFVVTRH